ncbi:MAG: hypothetical protein LBM95_07335, partial [Lactobacillales bacterium]|nr:hypothetical protein [Lactobacillales bacterium]
MSRAVVDFVLFGRLIRLYSALYLVSVRQFRSLRPASFSPYLTVDTLPFANSSYYQACSGLSPPSSHPCRAHQKKNQEVLNGSIIFDGGEKFTTIFWYSKNTFYSDKIKVPKQKFYKENT